jgi:hypothetical protein
MNPRPALLAAAALAALGTCLALGRWGAGWNRDLARLARAVGRGDDLEDHLAAIRRRHEAKRALAAEVVAGRMSLREAAGHFRHLDEADTTYPPDLPHPAADERALCEDVLDYGGMVLRHQGQFAAAVRWFAEAFSAEPTLLTGRPRRLRHNAACAAVLAGCGQGRDAADLDETSRAAFRRQALGWLRAELEVRRRLVETDPAGCRVGMEHWLQDPEFAGVRGPEALDRLPAAERQAWQQLWADVAATRARAQGEAPPEAVADRGSRRRDGE